MDTTLSTPIQYKMQIGNNMKTCIKCRLELPLENYYPRQANCKLCEKERIKQYRKNNVEKIIKLQKEYYKNNKDKIKKLSAKWTKNNPQYMIDYCNNHKEKMKIQNILNKNSIPAGVYMIKNLITGERYIGQSIKPYGRRVQHFSNLSYNTNQISNPQLQEAMKQYGKTYFVFGVLEHCDKEELLAKEQYYIDLYKPEYNAN